MYILMVSTSVTMETLLLLFVCTVRHNTKLFIIFVRRLGSVCATQKCKH